MINRGPGTSWGYEVTRGRAGGRDALVFAHSPAGAGAMLRDVLRWGDRECLVLGGERVTYRDLGGAVDALCSELAVRGLAPGDRIALTGSAGPLWVIALWSCLRAGLVAVPCDLRWATEEQERVARLVGPRLQIGDAALAGCPAPRIASVPSRPVPATGPPSVGTRPAPAEPAPALILFTAGTSGPPKGVVLSSAALVAGIQNMLAARRLLPCDLSDDHVGPVSLITLPLFHIGGITTVIASMLCGGRLIFAGPRFDPGEVLRLIECEKVTTWGAIPTMVRRAIEESTVRRHDLSSLRSLMIGGAQVATDLAREAADVFPRIRFSAGNTYGLTEACGHVATATGREVGVHPGCSGRPLPTCELRIGPAPEVPAGQGEILVRSPSLLTSYWGERDSPVDAGGWLHTGDFGYLDGDGRLYVVGRLKDIIIRGGENVSAVRVEHCLLTHPGVHDVAVVGLPSQDLGEEVAAAVVPKPGHRLDRAELAIHAAAQLSRFEVPTRWWIRETALPLNSAGKILKRQVRTTWPPGC
jgi:long-chain acyl-CoA synthetase